MTRNIFSTTLMLLAVLPAQAGVIAVAPANQSVLLGNQATVDISYSGAFIGDFDIDISWNTAIIDLASLSFGTQLGGPADSIQSSSPGLGTVNAFEISLLTDIPSLMALQPGQTATLLTLVFDTLSVGASPVSIIVNALGDENGNADTNLIVSNGQITVFQRNGVIPEPSSLLLMGAGVAWLAWRGRRVRAYHRSLTFAARQVLETNVPKDILLTLFCLTWIGFAESPAPAALPGALFPIQQNGKWGFIDAKGRVVVEPKFDQALAFSSGMGAIRVGKQWGYVDGSGSVRISPRLNDAIALPFCGAGAIVYDPQQRLTFIDTKGNLIPTKAWESYSGCREGVMGVREKRKWGFMSTDGKMLIEPQFEDASLFGEALVGVKMKDKWGFVDRGGRWVIEPQFDATGTFQEGLAPVRSGEVWGYVGRDSKLVIAPMYNFANSFSGGRARVLVVGADKVTRTGFIDKSGKLVVAAKYPVASDFVNSRAMVRIGNKFGYIDPTGALIIPAKYDWAGEFNGGLALVKTFENPQATR